MTLQRAQDYVDRGLVMKVETERRGAVLSRLSNGLGQTYNQHIALHGDAVFGACSCPMGHNRVSLTACIVSDERATAHGSRSHVSTDYDDFNVPLKYQFDRNLPLQFSTKSDIQHLDEPALFLEH